MMYLKPLPEAMRVNLGEVSIGLTTKVVYDCVRAEDIPMYRLFPES